ncbi:hypothetical protein [Anaplasma capra]|uniref:hypothetical protein n=1 Tax=Anaplasma capra TaxID=1562740 RepID=UPI0021D5F72F|nr:hypothetical protein [Anaplasma capra]MCU7611143.1 hypothetical protein [Anaplasma capra]MCU7612353.1 hypothetical protein [Anaplasma capra]
MLKFGQAGSSYVVEHLNYFFLNNKPLTMLHSTYTSIDVITYSAIDRQKVVLSFSDAQHVENLKERFTTLDAGVASRAIFSHGVSISYHEGNRVELVPDEEFTYHSVSAMINHMLNHGFTFKVGVLSEMMAQACNLNTEGVVILESGSGLSYAVSISKDTIALSPVSEQYLDFSSGPSQKLVEVLCRQGSVGSVTTDAKSRSIRISHVEGVCDTLAALSNALVKVGAVPREDEELARKQMIRLAFWDSASNELKVVRSIANYPNAHPLSKYKDVARTVENILHCLSNKTCDPVTLGRLEDALEQKGEFSGVPPVLTKGFAKLNRDFGSQLKNIIND